MASHNQHFHHLFRPSPPMCTPCHHCAASRATSQKPSILGRLGRFLKDRPSRPPPSVCHACGSTGVLPSSSGEVDAAHASSFANSFADQVFWPTEETFRETVELDTSGMSVSLFHGEEPSSKRQTTTSQSFVKRWVSQQHRVLQSSQRWERWSRQNLTRKGARRPIRFRGSAPHGLESIPEDAEPMLNSRRQRFAKF